MAPVNFKDQIDQGPEWLQQWRAENPRTPDVSDEEYARRWQIELASGQQIVGDVGGSAGRTVGWRMRQTAADGTMIAENLDVSDSKRFKATRNEVNVGDWPTIDGYSPGEIEVFAGQGIQTQWNRYYSANAAAPIVVPSGSDNGVGSFVRGLDLKYEAGTLEMFSELGNVWRGDDSGLDKLAKSWEWFTYQHPEGMNYGNIPTPAPNLRGAAFDNMLSNPFAAMIGGVMASNGASTEDVYYATTATRAGADLISFGGSSAIPFAPATRSVQQYRPIRVTETPPTPVTNRTWKSTLTNLRPGDAVVRQKPVRTLTQDASG